MKLASHSSDSFISATAIVNNDKFHTLPLTGIPVPKTEIHDIQKYLRSQFQERILNIMMTSEVRSQILHSIEHINFTNIRILLTKTCMYTVNDDEKNLLFNSNDKEEDQNDIDTKILFS